MPTDLLVLQHTARAVPGLLEEVAAARERSVHVVRAFAGDPVPQDADDSWALVVMGGPMAAWEDEKYPWLKDEANLIQACIKAGTPVLGICLGSQLVARAGGGRNYRGGMPEMGWYPIDLEDAGKADPLFAGIPPQFKIWEWHYDTYDLPEGAVKLASSRLYPNQAFRLGKNVYGVQFHPEQIMTRERIEKILTDRADEVQRFAGVIDPARIRRETEKSAPKAVEVGRRLFENFMSSALL
jgi:GMP synthase (glutamine-hydrolysing)